MADSLLAAFSEALDLPPEQARPLLDQALRLIGHRLDANESADVPGLGTFYRTGQGVRFVAAPALEQAVNHRYAGLAPVSPPEHRQAPPAPSEASETPDPFSSAGTIRPFAAPPPENPLESPLRDIAPEATPDLPEDRPAEETSAEETPAEDQLAEEQFAEDPSVEDQPAKRAEDEAPPDEPVAYAFDEPTEQPNRDPNDSLLDEAQPEDEQPARPPLRTDAEPLAAQPPALDPDDADDVNALLAGVWTPRRPDTEQPLGPMPDTFEDAEFDVEGRPPDEPTPPSAKPTAAPAPFAATRNPDLPPDPPKPAPRPEAAASRRSLLPVLLVGLLVLLLLGGAWWWLSRPTPPPPTFAEAPTEQPAPAEPVEPQPVPSEQSDALPPSESQPEAEPEREPTPVETPLRGSTPVTAGAGGYTWVVASEPSQADAERRAAALREQGYRVGVIPGQVSGRTYYRVGLGHYNTTAEAARFRDQLPDSAPPDTWRLRL